GPDLHSPDRRASLSPKDLQRVLLEQSRALRAGEGRAHRAALGAQHAAPAADAVKVLVELARKGMERRDRVRTVLPRWNGCIATMLSPPCGIRASIAPYRVPLNRNCVRRR